MITDERLREVSGWLARQSDDSDLESVMRSTFPELHFTFCSDDDVILDEPAASFDRYHLYLVDGSNHCLALTKDPDSASGLVVAAREDED